MNTNKTSIMVKREFLKIEATEIQKYMLQTPLCAQS